MKHYSPIGTEDAYQSLHGLPERVVQSLAKNNAISGFTHTIAGNKIPPRQPPYVAQYAKPCTTGKQLAKAIAPMPVQTFRGNRVSA